MKQFKLEFLLTVLMSMVGAKAFAYDIAVENADGVTIYYNYSSDGTELIVTCHDSYSYLYRGAVVIPDEVTYMNRTRKVTTIGNSAFYGCSGLTSVTIPNSVTSIGGNAFQKCSRLTSVTIPNSVTSIGNYAFNDCSGLTSITIPNSVISIGKCAFWKCRGLTSVTIGNSVTSIGDCAFWFCSGLTSVTIPNSVISIGHKAFEGCSGLTSVTIGNSVTSIGDYAFYECSRLTSVHISDLEAWFNIKFETRLANPFLYADHIYLGEKEIKDLVIPNSVTSIGEYAFRGCRGLTSVTIPNSVTSIDYEAFYGCSGLTSVTIGNSVTSIGYDAFDHVDLPTVISLIENPFKISGKYSDISIFTQNTFNNATLYVPKGTIDKYKSTDGWRDFLFIEEGAGPNGGGETPEIKKCATPTIGYQNGKLMFNCDTEGATCQYSITDDDIKSGSSNEVQLGFTYHISVYATKAGYENSDVTTATLCWIDVEPKTEGITNIVSNVRARAILIQSNGNLLTISGADEDTAINVFDISGRPAGSAKASAETTTINTTLRSGDIGIVKIGEKAVKVLMK